MVEYKWIALSNTTLGSLMANLDQSIVVIALPSIGKQLVGISPLDLIWIVVGYQLVLASVLVNFGRLSDIFGRVKLYQIGFIIFTFSSGLCSLSQTGSELVSFRLIQGLGAALLNSNSTAIVTDAFPLDQRGQALSFNTVASSAGNVSGFVLGGLLTGTLGWRSIFWVNVPIGVFAIIWTRLHLKELGAVDRKQKIDIKGNATFLISLVLILASITLYAVALLNAVVFTILLAIGLLSMFLFVRIESKVKEPMLKLQLFRIPSLALGNVAAFLNSLARGAVVLVMTFYLQGPTMNLTPFAAGLFLLANPVAQVVCAPIGGSLSDRYGPRIFTAVGGAFSAVGCLLIAQFGPTANFVQIEIALALVGAGGAIFASPNRASIMNSVPAAQRGVTSGVYQTFVQVGNVFSRALAFLVMGLILSAADLNGLFDGTLQSSSPKFAMNLVNAIHLIFYVSAGLLVISAIISAVRIMGARQDSENFAHTD